MSKEEISTPGIPSAILTSNTFPKAPDPPSRMVVSTPVSRVTVGAADVGRFDGLSVGYAVGRRDGEGEGRAVGVGDTDLDDWSV